MNESLEKITQISEQDLENSRRDFDYLGLVLHFGGEIVGSLYYCCIKGIVLSEGKIDYNNIGLGLAIYVGTQIPAFFFKGLSMTKEENENLARKFEKGAEKRKKSNSLIYLILNKPFINLHNHFSENYQKYEKIIKNIQ